MRISKATAGLLVLALCAGGLAAGPDPELAAKQADQATYNQLVYRVRQLDQDYARTVRKAMSVARKGAGKADMETMAQLLAIRDERDRAMARLTMVAMRHGWELPESSPGLSTPADASVESAQPVFKAAEHIIESRFSQEATKIALDVNLPVLRPAEPAQAVQEKGKARAKPSK